MTLKFTDRLGGVLLSPDLMKKINDFTPPTITEVQIEQINEIVLGDWQCIDSHLSSSDQTTIHRVESRTTTDLSHAVLTSTGPVEIRCTCQDFRIRKNKTCKHIVTTANKLGYTL